MFVWKFFCLFQNHIATLPITWLWRQWSLHCERHGTKVDFQTSAHIGSNLSKMDQNGSTACYTSYHITLEAAGIALWKPRDKRCFPDPSSRLDQICPKWIKMDQWSTCYSSYGMTLEAAGIALWKPRDKRCFPDFRLDQIWSKWIKSVKNGSRPKWIYDQLLVTLPMAWLWRQRALHCESPGTKGAFPTSAVVKVGSVQPKGVRSFCATNCWFWCLANVMTMTAHWTKCPENLFKKGIWSSTR